MRANDVTLEVGESSYPGRFHVPDASTDQGVLMVPGAGHGPFGDIFRVFAEEAADAGYSVARFETWPFPDDLEKSDAEFEAELEASVEFLRSRGCETITVIAKSFGGRVVLQHRPEAVDRMVLWAPAIKFGEHDEYPSITAPELAEFDSPVRLLRGDEDDVISKEDAESIAEHVPDGELVELPDEDHSFLRDHRHVIDETMAFLPASDS
ncbi:alpha/beta hydrolase [Saliphagus sp. GCM10025334]